MAYENGNGVEENPQKAVEYMMKAAEQDYGYAQFKMGDYYFFGCGPCLKIIKRQWNGMKRQWLMRFRWLCCVWVSIICMTMIA